MLQHTKLATICICTPASSAAHRNHFQKKRDLKGEIHNGLFLLKGETKNCLELAKHHHFASKNLILDAEDMGLFAQDNL